mmetsp:Transcript_21530/g.44320  ORF Transcript_21530/g.44320 Transcript_21530/m.44320 type:complete len:121 (+) Transcript_21530:1175-1537(+)
MNELQNCRTRPKKANGGLWARGSPLTSPTHDVSVTRLLSECAVNFNNPARTSLPSLSPADAPSTEQWPCVPSSGPAAAAAASSLTASAPPSLHTNRPSSHGAFQQEEAGRRKASREEAEQ